MYEQLTEILRDIAKQDFNQSPKLVFKGRLRAALIEQAFPVKTAEIVSAKMKVSISDGAMTDEQITETVNLFAEVICKMYDAYAAQGFEDPIAAVENSADDLSYTI